jgi:lipoprotein-anchoring transpeptidase ErfK/SrfK
METMTIKEHANKFCYVVIKWQINGREWTTNGKFTSRDKAEKFIKEEKISQLSPDVTYEIVDI